MVSLILVKDPKVISPSAYAQLLLFCEKGGYPYIFEHLTTPSGMYNPPIPLQGRIPWGWSQDLGFMHSLLKPPIFSGKIASLYYLFYKKQNKFIQIHAKILEFV